MSTAARRIVVEGGCAGGNGGNGRVATGAARGVELETLRGPLAGRHHVRCGAVVSNADLLQTWERLVPPERVPPGYVAELRRLRPTFPCFLVHLGLTGVDAAELERVQGYYWDSWDMDRVGVDALRFKLFAPTLYEPAMAPPGGQVLIVQKVLEMDYAATEARGALAGWQRHKHAIESFVLGHLERLLPGIGTRIAVRSSASAHTSWRFTWNYQGAMLGWEMSPEQLGGGRPTLAGPIDGLYTVGHWTRPGGGITPVIVSAQLVAKAVAAGGARLADAGADAAGRTVHAGAQLEAAALAVAAAAGEAGG